ncbi:TetR/AcrR family transcriptional regulator [Paraburkholderia sp. DHOC27]|uniref:TetR/AcrR family transcriptional regulator n=1 Tax=Paraburkholderia sp. DHOC27 TaxID=2303330 RepID=UPI001C709719|nr:TetR/AcrR family transcriptional regulator [Paraburkholderia sp. DHOC27]
MSTTDGINLNRHPRSDYHHGDLQNALITAGRRLLAARGVDALSLREAAREAGVSTAAPYRHFASKEALLAAMAAQGFQELSRAFEGALRRRRTSPALLRLAEAYVSFARSDPHTYRLMFRMPQHAYATYDELRESAGMAFSRLASAYDEYLGVTGGDPGTAVRGSVGVWSLVHGFALLTIDEQAAFVGVENLPDIADLFGLIPQFGQQQTIRK